MARAAARGCRLLLPTDVLWSSSLDGDRDTGLQVLTTSCCTQERPCIPPGGLRLRLQCRGMCGQKQTVLCLVASGTACR